MGGISLLHAETLLFKEFLAYIGKQTFDSKATIF